MSGCGNTALPLPAAGGESAGLTPPAPTASASPIIIEPPTPALEPVPSSIPSPTIFWPTPTPHRFVGGGVEILNDCCINAVDGDTITIRLRFSPTISPSLHMRMATGSGSDIMNQPINESEPWTPVVAEAAYDISASMIVDSRYAVCVEYRDAYLNTSPTSCDEIEITVMRTPTPIPSPTPVLPVGSVDIPDRISVHMDQKRVKDVEIQADFAASSPFGQITNMRVTVGYYQDYHTLSDADMAAYPWEPFVPTRIYTTTATLMVNVNWGLCVQYRDDQGNRSRVSCAGTLIEAK
jgi:hypothetical protein